MGIAHNLGFPRIGARRELKRALEAYWKGDIDRDALEHAGRDLRARHWALQAEAGLDYIPVGDFSWYDQVLDMSVLLGAVPERFGSASGDIDTYFRMARGRARPGDPHGDVAPCEMTKWFDTNYHYIVPELGPGQHFALTGTRLFDEVDEALAAGHRVKPVLTGPLTWLWLAKPQGEEFDRLALLPGLVAAYVQILQRLNAAVDWVQLDEPILTLDLPPAWRAAFASAYGDLAGAGRRILLATYFGELGDNLDVAAELPVAGLHVDLARAPEQLDAVLQRLPAERVLSLGVVDGRNVWRTDLEAVVTRLEPAYRQRGERLWVAPSCSLLHVPTDLELEDGLAADLKAWLAFARQKLDEVVTIRRALAEGQEAVAAAIADSAQAVQSRRTSERIHVAAVQRRLAAIDEDMKRRRHPFAERAVVQHQRLRLPTLPTTTIGSFPQTAEIRAARRDHRAGRLDHDAYLARMRAEIAATVRRQEEIGLDVLVHGEAERNDMVEYFGELLDGFAFTGNGWVQSYGSRAVKPPIIFGDVSRPAPMTVDWITYAQSLTDRPMKGMLTGPVTILQWSFVRDDQPRATTAAQIALALRDEVADLEAAGIRIVQIDEPALREGLPLRRARWGEYLTWAVDAFRLASSGVEDHTQIHTHMCYSEFNDIIESIARLDADVISIESSRSRMDLLDAFRTFEYPNEIGPGVYDIHSPRVPDTEEMVQLLERARHLVPVERLWVNPDCGLKTRGWGEVEPALRHMVAAAHRLRAAASE